jgi:phasin family protein
VGDTNQRPKTVTETAASMAQEATRRATETMASFGRAAAERQSALFGDVTRLFGEMRFPTALPDTNTLLVAHRRNMDALSQANRMALEGAQAVAKRHMEIMQQTMTELTDQVRELAGAHTPQAKAARQAELLKRSYEHAVNNMRELSDLIQRSNGEALALLDHRFREAMDEVHALLEKSADK